MTQLGIYSSFTDVEDEDWSRDRIFIMTCVWASYEAREFLILNLMGPASIKTFPSSDIKYVNVNFIASCAADWDSTVSSFSK